MKHKCPVDGCTVEVPHEMLMCYQHWKLVPATLKKAVWREYYRGPQSAAHLAACALATEAVNNLTKRSILKTTP